MRAVVSTMLALMFGGGVSLVAGSASSAPARAAAPHAVAQAAAPHAAAHAAPRAAVSTIVGATADCTIMSSPATSNAQCGGASDNTIGSDGNGVLFRTMVSFAGGLGIPAGSTVSSATLTIHVLGAFGSTATWVFGMTRNFAAGAATWNTYDGVHPWSTAGGDYNNTLQASAQVAGAGAVSFDITSLAQGWVSRSNPIQQLMILGFSPKGNAYTFANQASGNGPVLSVTYTPPPPPTTTTGTSPTGPVVTTPVPTPLPVAHGVHALRIKVLLSWTWNGARIRLRKVKVGSMPGDTKLRLGCQGAGCPRHSAGKASGARKVRRALLRLAGRRYRAGDVLTVKLTAARYRQERARIFFRNGKRPLVLG